MIKKILLILVPILAFLGGAAGGHFLRGEPPPEAAVSAAGGSPETGAAAVETGGGVAEGASTQDAGHERAPATGSEEMAFFRFPTQFFVPIMLNGDTQSTMILSLTLEMPKAAESKIHAIEHRLRDALLRALMIHANTGGFSGNYTADAQMDRLRTALLKAARAVGGDEITSVLVEDIARQMS